MPNMKFLCLNLWLGEVCTDDTDDITDANDDARWTKLVIICTTKHRGLCFTSLFPKLHCSCVCEARS